MLELFHGSSRQLREQVQQLARELDELRTNMHVRVQQVEEECARIRLQRMLREVHKATHLAIRLSLPAARAIEAALRATAAPLPRGKAGGLARARTAWRYTDGTLMPEEEKIEAYREEYERHAAGGRSRASRAPRALDGTFLSGAKAGTKS